MVSEDLKKTLAHITGAHTFSLDNFEGPLELLLYLIQKDEIDICEIAIKPITTQFMRSFDTSLEVDISSETLTLAASLLVLKSQKLLPADCGAVEVEEDPRLELIQSLIEYCRFKDTAKILTLREEEQKAQFPRSPSPFQKELGSGLEEIGIDHLKALLSDVLKRARLYPQGVIKEEEWQVSQKLSMLRHALSSTSHISFETLFSETKTRLELIVLFLALLEMMKYQEAVVVKENEKLYITSYVSRT